MISWLTLVIHDWAATKLTNPELPQAGPVEHIDTQERILAASLTPHLADSSREEKIFYAQIRGHFEENDFQFLEEISDTLRNDPSPKTRFGSGTWKLFIYHEALRHRFSNEDPWYRQNIDLTKKWMKAYPDSTSARVAYAQSLLDYSHFLPRESFTSKQYIAKAHLELSPILNSIGNAQSANPHAVLVEFRIQRSQEKSISQKTLTALLGPLDENNSNYHHLHQYIAKRLRWERNQNLSWETYAERIYHKNTSGPLNYLHIVNAQKGGYGSVLRDASAKWALLENGLRQAENLYPDSLLWLSYKTYYAVCQFAG